MTMMMVMMIVMIMITGDFCRKNKMGWVRFAFYSSNYQRMMMMMRVMMVLMILTIVIKFKVVILMKNFQTEEEDNKFSWYKRNPFLKQICHMPG